MGQDLQRLSEIGKSYRTDNLMDLRGDSGGLKYVGYSYVVQEIIETIKLHLDHPKVLEICGGVGGFSTLLSKDFKTLVIESQPERARLNRLNVEEFGDKENYQILACDVFDTGTLREVMFFAPEVIVVDPEWNNDGDLANTVSELSQTLPRIDMLWAELKQATHNWAIHLPASIDLESLNKVFGLNNYRVANHSSREHKVKFVTVYTGVLV